jgi:hypothetical protein
MNKVNQLKDRRLHDSGQILLRSALIFGVVLMLIAILSDALRAGS